MIKSADLKNKILFLSFAAFCTFLIYAGKIAGDLLLRMVGDIKVSCDRLRCVFVVALYVTKVFSETVT